MDIENLNTDLLDGMDNIQSIYECLNSQAKELVKAYTSPIDNLIKEVSNNINNLSNEDVRRIELRLSLLSYDLGELKDKTNIAAEIAEIVQDETQADAFNTAAGNNEQRKNTAILASSKEKAVAKLYKLVASQIKTKLDEAHRVVASLQSILISRASDKKLVNNFSGECSSNSDEI